MGRRFPTPIIGIPTEHERHRAVVRLVTTTDEPLSWDEFVDRGHQHILNPTTGEQYSIAYMRRMLSSYAEIGVIQRTDEGVIPSPFAADWLGGADPFSEFLWKSLKRSWIAMGTKPEGIEGLERILTVLESSDEPQTRSRIQEVLASEYDYEFNNEGVRGYPDLMELLGIIDKDGHSYTLSDKETVEKYKRRFRNTDIFDTLESRLKREGSMVTPPSKTAKRDLMKYYMYRESGGWHKRRGWYKTFWTDYLKPETRAGMTGDELRRKDTYRHAHNERSELRNDIVARFEEIDSTDLHGLSAAVLERVLDAESIDEAQRICLSAGSGMSRATLKLLEDSDRQPYSFPDGFELYDWQAEAASQWFAADDSKATETGIVRVVTGAGKTVMALDVIRQWLHDGPDDRVATIVVPTKVLMRQWLTELVGTLNVPVEEIGWAGGGHKDDFQECRIIVSIINSAVKDDHLGDALADAGSPEHLLVADECHRYTGETFSNIFSYHRTASLGLSATPVSRGDELTESDRLLLRELGDIYYELSYDEGIRRGLIPEFTIQYVGFDLAEPERREYEELSRQVSNAVKEIKQRYEYRLQELSGSFSQKLQVIRNSADGPTGAISDYFQYTQERRELVADAVSRQAITLHLLSEAVDAGQNAIVFQERIDQLEQLIAPWDHRGVNARTGEMAAGVEGYRQRLYDAFDGLKQVDQEIEDLFSQPNYWPVMYHSGHSREVWNDIAMDWFREDDMANVMLSVKALIEGVDVPSADVGIVRVSSSSIRQRIQTLGRILRTGEDASKRSTLYVLYARDTVDERIFREYDWQSELASANVEHKIWERAEEDDYATGEIRDATPEEYPPRPMGCPDPDELSIGDAYDGPREIIQQVSVDNRGQLFEKTRDGRTYLKTDGFDAAIDFVLRKKGGGTLYVNECNHLITMLPDGPVFLQTVDGTDVFEPTGESPGGLLSNTLVDEDGQSRSEGGLADEPDSFDDIFD